MSLESRNMAALSAAQQARDNSLPPEYEDEIEELDYDDIDPGYDGILGEG